MHVHSDSHFWHRMFIAVQITTNRLQKMRNQIYPIDCNLVTCCQCDECVLCVCSEYLGPGAADPVNVDCRVADAVKRNIENSPDRYCFEEAEVTLC